jgi:hypothetical protein
MMVLTVDVVGNSSSDSDELRAGGYGQEPSFGKKDLDDVGEADAAFTTQDAGGRVKSENAVEAAAVDQASSRV